MNFEVLTHLQNVIESRKTASADTSYTASLFKRGRTRIAQKVGEEAVETVIAAVADDKGRIVSESADLIYHLLVLLADAGLTLDDVCACLEKREGVSGLDEKKNRKKEC